MLEKKQHRLKVNKIVLNGNNSFEYTYSYPKQKLYVMLSDEESIEKAKELIRNIYE